jgi:hypothetical protein
MMRSLLLTAALLCACAKVTYVNPKLPATGTEFQQTGHFFLFGLVGTAEIPAYQACPHGVARVQSKVAFADLLLHIVTVNIYTPRTYVVRCGA